MQKHIDLDAELRPRRSDGQVPPPLDGLHPDPANLMDNWLKSAQEIEKQWKDQTPEWKARKELDPDPERAKSRGRWQYTNDESSKQWNPDRFWVDAKTGEPCCPKIVLEANQGDLGTSVIYGEWLKGNQKEFLDVMYESYEAWGKRKKGDIAADKFIPELALWRIFRCLVLELIPQSMLTTKVEECDIPKYIRESPDMIWQVGKCMFHLITRGRFWNVEYNGIQPVDGMKFGEYKQRVLQKNYHYSRNLLKFVLACLSSDPNKRPSRHELLGHFSVIFSVYDGSYKPVIIHDSLSEPYKPKYPLIPKGLTNGEGAVYEKYIQVVDEREAKGDRIQSTPHIAVITDIAKDYDDLLAMICLKELHRLGVLVVKGFVANLYHAEYRARISRGALDSMGYNQAEIPVAIGTAGSYDYQKIKNDALEYSYAEQFIVPGGLPFPRGQQLLKDIYTEAETSGHKLTLLTISSLMDSHDFILEYPDLFKANTSEIIMQGGYRVIKNVLVPDPEAQNNSWDIASAIHFHKFMQDNKIPSVAWTKVAANSVPLYNELFQFLEETRHPLGPYLRTIQLFQDLDFYKRACSDEPFAPHMTQEWYINNRSTWYLCGHEPDEPFPVDVEIEPYFTKVIAYDALPAVAAAGQDTLEKFGLMKEIRTRKDMDHEIHKVVGIPEVPAEGLGAEINFDVEVMGGIIKALLKGSLLASLQGLGRRDEEPK